MLTQPTKETTQSTVFNSFLSAMTRLSFVMLIIFSSTTQANSQPTVSVTATVNYVTSAGGAFLNDAPFTIKVDPPFTEAQTLRLNLLRSIVPSGSNETSVTEIPILANREQTTVTRFFEHNSVDYNSVKLTLTESNLYNIDSNASSATVYKVTTTSPGVSISATSNEIFAGDSNSFNLTLTSAPGNNVQHRVKISWEGFPGLVKSVGGEDTTSVTEKTVSVQVDAADTEPTSSARATMDIITALNVLDGEIGKISASLIQEDPIMMEDPVYDPIYHPTSSTTIVNVKEEKIEWEWFANFDGVILVTGESVDRTNYGDESGRFTITKKSTTAFEYEITEFKGTAPQTGSGVQTNFFHQFKDWEVSFPSVIIKPGRGNAINSLSPGESWTSNFICRLKNGNIVVDELTVTVTMRYPIVNMTFGDGSKSDRITSNNSGNYGILGGMDAYKNTQDTVARPVFSTSENADFFSERTAMLDSGSSQPTSNPVSIDGIDAYPVGQNFEYGTWYFSLDGSRYQFRPNVNAIDNLALNATVTSTATVTLYDSDQELSHLSDNLTVTLVGNGPPGSPFVSVEAMSVDSCVTESTGIACDENVGRIKFTISSSQSIETDLIIGISAKQEGDFVFGRVPRRIMIPAGQSSKFLEILIDDDNKSETDGSVSVSIDRSTDRNYRTQESVEDRTAMVRILDNDNVSGVSQEEYSVAAIALAEILSDSNQSTMAEGSPHSVDIPLLTVESLSPVINEGGVAVFSITSSLAPTMSLKVEFELVIVDVEIRHNSTNSSIILPAGQRNINLETQTIDDSHAGPDGTITMKLKEGDGYQVVNSLGNTAVASVSDVADREQRVNAITGLAKMNMPVLTWKMGSNSFNAISSRFDQNDNGSGSTLNLLGHTSVREMLVAGGNAANNGTLDWNSMLSDSHFTIKLSDDENQFRNVSFWGIGDYRELSDSNTLNSGHIGFDSRIGETGLIGLAATFSSNNIGHDNSAGQFLQFNASSTGIQPYLGWRSIDESKSLWITTNYNSGKIRIDETGYETESADTIFQMAGSGVNWHIPIWSKGSSVRSGLDLTGETWFAHQVISDNGSYIRPVKTEVGRFKFSAQINRQLRTIGNANLNSSVSLALIREINNSFPINVVEIGTGVTYGNSSGLSVTGNSLLFVSSGNHIWNQQYNAKLRYDRYNDRLGFDLELEPEWLIGINPSSVERDEISLHSIEELDVRSSVFQLESEIGYGFQIKDDSIRLRPFGGVDLVEVDSMKYRIGGNIEYGPMLDLRLEGNQKNDAHNKVDHQLRLNGTIGW